MKAAGPAYVSGSAYTPKPMLASPYAVSGLTCANPENAPGGTVHTPAHPAFALILLALLVTLGYLARVWLRPFKACRHCDGMGRIRTRLSRVKPCRKCSGHGIRRRAWRAPANQARAVLRDAFDQPTDRSRS